MKIGKTLCVTNGKDWRSWLKKNHSKEKEIWLIYYKKSSGKPRIPYNDAVEEALCYGWIDSTVKSIDENKYAQRFTPRRLGSKISEMNKERMRRLIKQKRMTLKGIRAVEKVFDLSKDKTKKHTVAPDIIKALKTNRTAWKNFQQFPEGYKKVRIGYIEGYRNRNMEEFKKKLRYFIKMTAKNKKYGLVQ